MHALARIAVSSRHLPKCIVSYPAPARLRASVGTLAGKGIGSTQDHAGCWPQPSALKTHSRSGVRPVSRELRVGEHTGDPE